MIVMPVLWGSALSCHLGCQHLTSECWFESPLLCFRFTLLGGPGIAAESGSDTWMPAPVCRHRWSSGLVART